MIARPPVYHDDFDDPPTGDDQEEALAVDDLWFLPGPHEEEPYDPLPRTPAVHPQPTVPEDWRKAEAANAARLANLAGRLGALHDRLMRGPPGWRHRLALIEAANLSWVTGDRIGPDRLALWVCLHLGGVQDDTAALSRAAWAVRRLTGGPGPQADLSAFLDRRDPQNPASGAEPLTDRTDSWSELMAEAADLHPITRAAMGFHLWSLAGLDHDGSRMEAAVTAARLATSERPDSHQGAIFMPLATGGAGGLRAGGTPTERLARWIDSAQTACLAAMRHLDDIEAWSIRVRNAMTAQSGRTPPALRDALTEWPAVSAPMAQAITGASRAAVQRNLAWMQNHGLIREITGQGRYRMWRAAL